MKKYLILPLLLISMQLIAQQLPTEKSVIEKSLPNGLRYTVIKNNKPQNRAEIRLYVGAGSLDETEEQRGLAHFVEHMAFNGIKHFKKNELVSYLESMGMVFGGDLNANTTHERTLYMLSVPLKEDNLKKSLQVVRDWADGLNFDPQEYEKERRIILEERRLRDTADMRLLNQMTKVFYGDSQYTRRDPIGNVDVIKQSNVSVAKAFYDTWYRPELMHLVVVGDINTTKVIHMIEQNMASIKSKSHKKQTARVAKDFNRTQILSITDKELTRDSVNIFYTTDISPMRTLKEKREALRKNIVQMIVNLQAKDQLLRKDPKAMEMQMFTDRVSKNRQVYGFVATYKNGNGLDALEELYGFVSSFEKYGFSITDFELAKRLILSNLEKTHARYMDIQSKDIAKILVETIENNSTYIDHNYDYNTTKKLISSMTLEEINQTFKDILNIQNRAIIFKDTMGHKFAENRVYEVLKNASKNAGDLSKVEKVASHIIDTNLTKGKIVSKKFDSQLGIYSYKLENNITVEFRPDSQNKNLLTLEAFSAGGYSILKGEELLISKNATNIVMQSAPANWTNIELAKILTGKEIEVVPSIERFGEKIVATCNTKDIDMMFELLYARVTKAKVDTRVLENMKVMLSDNIIQAKRNPQYLLLMDVLKEYYNDNPEIKPISKEQISRLKASSILALYRDRFADMNNFHFVISGDTTTETIERLIGKYLANLPTQNRVEEYNTKRYSHPSGKVQITKYYNTENRANITMQYSSKVDFNTKNNLRTMIASNILSIRLRTLIREEKSGVYNIGVKTELTHELKDEAITNITFACDPIRKDELIDAIYPAIDELNRNGVTTQELAELKKMIHLEYEKQIGQNSFWADNIMSSHRFHTPKDDIINLPKILDSITKEDIQETAQALFGDDILIAILMPKKYHAIDKQGEKK